MRLKLKQKVAAFLAVSMVISGQPGTFAMTSAAEEKPVQTMEDSNPEDLNEAQIATPANAEKATPDSADQAEQEDETYEVLYMVDPEEGARVKGDKKVDTGETLEFTVTVEKGYRLTDVYVSGDAVEPVSQDGDKYEYQIEDILMQPEVEVVLEEIEYPEFSETQDVGNDVTISLYAEEGVLPAGTTFEAVSLEDADEGIAEAAREQVLTQTDSQEDAAYGAYQIALIGDDGEALSDDEIDGNVVVTVNGVNGLMENGEIFDVDEDNPIPTDVYRVKEKTTLLDRILPSAGELRVDKVKQEKADEYENDDAAYEMKSAVENIVLMPSTKAAPKLANMQLLVDLYGDETVEVQIDGVDGETNVDLPVGTIADNAPEYENYTYEYATISTKGADVVAVGVYVIDGTRYEYYSTDGESAQLIEDNPVVLHYSQNALGIAYTVSPDPSYGTITGPETAEEGAKVSFVVEPALGYKTSDVQINGESVFVQGQNVYTFTMPDVAVKVSVTLAWADSYNVTLNPLGNSKNFDYHDYFEEKCQTPSSEMVQNGDTLETCIYIDDAGRNLVYIVVNNERIEINNKDNTTATVDGMNITIVKKWHEHKHEGWLFDTTKDLPYFEITIPNVQQDIRIDYFIKDDRGIEERTIQIDELGEGVELYVKEESSDELRSVAENDIFTLGDYGSQIHFYAKAEPGYQVTAIEGEGVSKFTTIQDAIAQDQPGAEEALAYGCQWELHFTRFLGDEANRTLEIRAVPVEYHVNYDANGGEPTPVDNNVYSVAEGSNTITLAAAPEKAGEIFLGWKLADNIYGAGNTITVDVDFLETVDLTNTFNFVAQWAAETAVANYTVKYYKEAEVGIYPNEPDLMRVFKNATVGDTAVANATPDGFDISGYVLDTKQEEFQVTGTVTDDDALVLKVYYALDKNNNGIADRYEQTTVTFKVAAGDESKGSISGTSSFTGVAGSELTVPTVTDTQGDEWAFDGWSPELTEEDEKTVFPTESVEYVAKWAEDKNHNNTPDHGEKQITVTFDVAAGDESKGSISGTSSFTGVAGSELTVPTVTDTKGDDWAFAGWMPQLTKNAEGTVVFPASEEGKVDYVALWALDKDHNNIPDDEEGAHADITFQPYATTVYTGGSNNDTTDEANSGFPNLDIQYVEEDRQIRKDAIAGIYVNDVNVGSDVDEVFKAVYWNEETTAAAENDQVSDIYNTTIVLGEAALGAVPGATARDGYLYDANGQRIPVRDQKVEVVAHEEDALVIYNVDIQDSELTVRPLTDPTHPEETYRSVYEDPSQISADAGAAAVISSDSQFYTNGDGHRQVGREGIRLLVDTIQNQDMDREEMLIRKANEATGVTDAQNWAYVARYLDLIDVNDGNAWVSSSAGTDVYFPYPDGTDQNTEFTLLHFAGLHREEGLDGEDAAAAIESSVPSVVAVENTAYGIRFHVTEGGFSPFVLMYRTAEDTPNVPDTPDDGENNDHGGSSGNSGSDDSDRDIRTGSSRDSAYIVGIDGNWVHMDPANPNIPITVEVPEWATPVTNPEYHQWKFYLNNGLILWGRWAYLKNPYAVGDQPREGKFYFDNDGIMQYGWYLDNADGKWYYLHRTSDGMLGTQIEGWHFDDQDKKWYYLKPGTGEMVTGWQLIDGKWYYFNPVAPTATWNYDEATGGWTYNGSTSRPYGSMYQNEMTPDGYRVDENGAWVQ